MANRLKLDDIFREILGNGNVYFQPPENVRMKYPAIVYDKKKINNTFADNKPYMQSQAYEVTVIDKDPESKYVVMVSQLPMCSHDRHFQSDNLNHDVFTIFN